MNRKLFSGIVFLMLMLTASANVRSQDPPNHSSDDAVKIFEYYQDCVVDFRTSITLETGEVVEFGGSAFFLDNADVKRLTGKELANEAYLLSVAHVVKVENDEINIGFHGKVKIVNYSYWVTLVSKNKKYKADLLGVNEYADLALLKISDIQSDEFKGAKLGNPKDLKVGEKTYAVGTPYGLSTTLTTGVVSSLHRTINLNYLEDFIQTDAPINPGNSGSPLMNSRGEVIGINDARIPNADGMGFSISLDLVNFIQLSNGQIVLPWFGLEALINNFARSGNYEEPGFQDIKFLNAETKIEHLKTLIMIAQETKDHWALINLIDERHTTDGKMSPAKKAGMRLGDIIVKLNGKSITSGMDIRRNLLDIALGQNVEVEFIRIEKGVKQELKRTLSVEKRLSNEDGKPLWRRRSR